MSKRITQLQVATNKTITPNDLIVGAGLDGVIMKNFKLNIGNFCNYFNHHMNLIHLVYPVP